MRMSNPLTTSRSLSMCISTSGVNKRGIRDHDALHRNAIRTAVVRADNGKTIRRFLNLSPGNYASSADRDFVKFGPIFVLHNDLSAMAWGHMGRDDLCVLWSRVEIGKLYSDRVVEPGTGDERKVKAGH